MDAPVVDLASRRLARSLEQALAAEPTGLPLMALIAEAGRRQRMAGEPHPTYDTLLAHIGVLIASGRVDERQGRLVLRATEGSRQAA